LTWPLTGRSEEMRIVQAALQAPETSGIVLCGAAGVGKSRIAHDALASAGAIGCQTRWVSGTSSARQLPLGALAAWAGSSGTDHLQLIRDVIDALTSTSDGAKVIVGVDDAHLLDDLSTFVLHQIVARRAAKLVLTIRSGDPIPTATQEIWQAGQFDRLDLQPLSRHETVTLLSATLGGALDSAAAQRLWKLTRGNALYLRNIVEQGVADGHLVEQHGHWTWTGDTAVPPSLAEMIETRIGDVPRSVGDVIDALAVGEPIELSLLVRIVDAAAVEEADQRGLITLERSDGRAEVRLAHPLYGEVRRGRAPATRLRRLCARLAVELGRSDDRDDTQVVVRRAVLSLDSDLEPDPDLLVTAAYGALGLADLHLADRLAHAAIRAGGGAEAGFVRAFALSRLGLGEEADTVLASITTAGGDHARRAFMRATIRLFTHADPAGAKQLIDDASQAVPPDGNQACIDAFQTVYWAAMGRPDAARESSKNLVVEELPPFVGAVTARAVVVASGDAGHTSEAQTAADAGYAIVRRDFDAPHQRFVVADAHISALLQSGRLREAWDMACRVQELAAELAEAAQPYSALVVGRAALGAGRLDTAHSLLKSAVGTLSASGETIGWRYRCQIPYTIALAMHGATDEATAALEDLEQCAHPSWQCVDYERALAQAWVAARQGAVSEAINVASSAAEEARARGQFAAEVLCLQAATQFGDRSGAPRLSELAEIVEGPRARVAARFAAALGTGDGAGLTKVSEDFERMGDLVAAIDSVAHGAVAYRRKGLRGSALGCATRAAALSKRCGGANTPALLSAAEPLPLTSRQREIVMLLGDGLTTRTIAERLNVSERTVEGHIYRAMAKTGVANRNDLAALLPRHASMREGT
jgi:DNA-binding CsgD family transcriptional regulator